MNKKKKYKLSGKNNIRNTIISVSIVVMFIVIALIIRIYFIKESPYLENKEQAVVKCVDLCEHTRKFERLDPQGPCLKEEIVPGWGCDVVHNPRLPLVDDDKNNRCLESRHVVEVSFTCEFVSAK